MKPSITCALGAAAGLALAVLTQTGCEIGSPDTAVRAVSLVVEGLYRNPDGNLVSRNTGASIAQLDLRQTGDQLQGVDNNNRVFNGSIGRVVGASAQFSVEGTTTAGSRGTLAGTIDLSGTTATMRGTWIESSLTGQVFGQATVATNTTPTPAPTNTTALALSPAGPVSLVVGGTQGFTASGGNGSYTWSVADSSLGAIAGTGDTVTYGASAVGTQTVSVADATDTRSVTVIQN